MKSMTGYGYSEYSCDKYILTMELKSYNNKYLEVNYFAPQVLSSFETEFNDRVKEVSARGHVDLSIRLKTLRGDVSVSVDEAALDAYLDAYNSVSDRMKAKNIKFRKAKPTDFMAITGVLASGRCETIDEYREGLDYCTNEVLKQYETSKNTEGLATKKDLESKIDSFDSSLSEIKKNASELEKQIKDNLTSRMNEMLSDQNYDENRILQEVAVMLMRYTINEETVRLDAHIKEFRRLLELNEPVGKKLDFLCQEMNREVNTIGSKSQMVAINLEVVNMKDCLENIREQTRNIE